MLEQGDFTNAIALRDPFCETSNIPIGRVKALIQMFEGRSTKGSYLLFVPTADLVKTVSDRLRKSLPALEVNTIYKVTRKGKPTLEKFFKPMKKSVTMRILVTVAEVAIGVDGFQNGNNEVISWDEVDKATQRQM